MIKKKLGVYHYFEWQLYNPIVLSVVFCWREGKKKRELYTYLN